MTDVTDTAVYPVFADKEAMFVVLQEAIGNKDRLMEFAWRLSNTDTSTWADPTVTFQD